MYDPVGHVREGIEKYKGGMFRIATLQGEYVLVPDREQVAEYIRVSDDVLGMQEAANDVSLMVRLIEQILIMTSNNNSNGQWATASLIDRIILLLSGTK